MHFEAGGFVRPGFPPGQGHCTVMVCRIPWTVIVTVSQPKEGFSQTSTEAWFPHPIMVSSSIDVCARFSLENAWVAA